MKKYETTKLFWGTYLYRLTIRNQLSPIFREKNLSYARQVLDKLQHEYEKGEKLQLAVGIRERPITEEHFLDAKKLYKYFNKFDDFKLRVEGPSLSIYANDKDWLNTISSSIYRSNLVSLHEPDPNFIDKLDSNVILVSEDIGFEYRVTVGQNKGTPEFAKWADHNPNLVKIGPVLREEMLSSGYVNGMYFYARDERILQLCNLMLSNIRRIDKLVVKQSLDK